LELNVLVSDHAPEKSERFAQAAPPDPTRIAKVVGLYGPNASGKSTVLRALGFLSWFIQYGFHLDPGAAIPCDRFNSDSHLSKPITIELEFDAPIGLSEEADSEKRCRYSYSLTLDGGAAQPTNIKEESLCYWPPETGRRVCLFQRTGTKVSHRGRAFKAGGYSAQYPNLVRANVSLISMLAQFGHVPSVFLRDIAGKIETNIIVERRDPHEGATAELYLSNPRLFQHLNREIPRLDFGISEVEIKPANQRNYPAAEFVHRGLANPLLFTKESEGTRQFFKIFPMISQALHFGGVAVIDEFDGSIHPLVLPEILRWFYDTERNAKNAQLWFTGQNPYLLGELEKEQIILCEKDDHGSSTAFRLSDMKNIRRVENYEKKYLGGAYGAIPHFG